MGWTRAQSRGGLAPCRPPTELGVGRASAPPPSQAAGPDLRSRAGRAGLERPAPDLATPPLPAVPGGPAPNSELSQTHPDGEGRSLGTWGPLDCGSEQGWPWCTRWMLPGHRTIALAPSRAARMRSRPRGHPPTRGRRHVVGPSRRAHLHIVAKLGAQDPQNPKVHRTSVSARSISTSLGRDRPKSVKSSG